MNTVNTRFILDLKAPPNNIKTIPTRYHVIFWISYFTFSVFRWGSYYEDYWYSFKSNLVTIPMAMILAYVNIYLLVPKFIFTKKFKRYIFYFLLSLCIFYMIRTELIYWFINKNVWPESESPQTAYSFNHIVAVFLIGIYEVAIVTSLKLTIDWFYERKRIEQLQNEHLKTELKFLRAQIQPHFFFNTLNNLYALTLRKSDKAPEVVLKLSDIMQYVLYDVKGSKVMLLKEVEYIKNYLDLEKLRHGNNVTFELNVEGSIENVKVPPLLFLSFIENSFKHGTTRNKDFYVNIWFKRLNNTLVFIVENSFVKAFKKTKGGIGNLNLKRRLDLLFGENYKLEIKNLNNLYNVQVEIPLEY